MSYILCSDAEEQSTLYQIITLEFYVLLLCMLMLRVKIIVCYFDVQ